MIFRSPYPAIDIPEVAVTPFVLRHAKRLANKPAFVDGLSGETLTYGQLATSVERVAAGLVERGFDKGDVFAIIAPNSIDYAIAFHAIATIGGIAAPLNPSFTPADAEHLLHETGACCIFTTPELLDTIRQAAEGLAIRDVFVFGEAGDATPFATLLKSEGRVPSVVINPREDVVAILCSSGTTGLPKGAQLTHFNLVASLCQLAVTCPTDEHDTLPGHLPFFHVFGLWIGPNFCPAQGATSVLMPRFDLAQFLQLAQDYRMTRAFLVPPVILALAKNPMVAQYDLSTLKVIVSGAAPLGAEVASGCTARVGCVVKQLYGLTEIPPSHMAPDDLDPRRVGTVGPCMPNTECKIVDIATGDELDAGELGEIWVRGPNVMKGYLNRPEATAAMIDREGWVHTGDIGSCEIDGYLTVADRLKELIKYKAHQVAPAELEAVLLAHPAVADAAVIPSPDEAAGEVPKAFVVLTEEVSAEDLLAFVAERVAPYKKVRRLEFIDQIPKSATGKILRRVLVERERTALLISA
jgi:acyl-CoA synthetase (AMP-forming)/AMP-acid ligase II